MKKSILQWAIEGKLVPQLESEPEVAQIGEVPENVPFAIPQKWKWVPVNKIIELISGRDLDKSLIEETESSSSVPYITGASQISNNDVLVNRWTNNGSVFSNTGDLLLTCKGTVGKLAINQIGICHIARQIMAIRQKDQISSDFAKIFFSAIGNKLISNAKSMIPGISRNNVLSLLCPLPPIEEQQRIVAKLNELLSLVETYGKEQEALEKLEKEFPDKLRASLLQEAIQGKLVPQLESEPAVKQLGEAPEDVPFAIPEKWKWVRLRNLVSIAKQKIPDSEFYYIDVSGIDSVKRKICTLKKLTAGNAPSRARKVVEQGMVLYSTVRPYLLNTVVVEEIFDKFDLIASTAFATFKCLADLNNHYIWYVLQSPYFTQHVSAIQKGVAYPAVSDRDFYSSYIPIPPIEEQRRIVTKLNELLPLVETYGKEQEALEKMEKEFPDKLRAVTVK